MNVKELKEFLKDIDDDVEVFAYGHSIYPYIVCVSNIEFISEDNKIVINIGTWSNKSQE